MLILYFRLGSVLLMLVHMDTVNVIKILFVDYIGILKFMNKMLSLIY
jgi:hypothetical protein